MIGRGYYNDNPFHKYTGVLLNQFVIRLCIVRDQAFSLPADALVVAEHTLP